MRVFVRIHTHTGEPRKARAGFHQALMVSRPAADEHVGFRGCRAEVPTCNRPDELQRESEHDGNSNEDLAERHAAFVVVRAHQVDGGERAGHSRGADHRR